MLEDTCVECDDVFSVDHLFDGLCLVCRDWRIAQDFGLVGPGHWMTSGWNRL